MATELNDLKQEIDAYMAAHGGKVYAAIPHPAFAHLPAAHKRNERIKIIRPHLDPKTGTVLDIGTNWGHMAHELESLGYKVTALEIFTRSFKIADGIRRLCAKQFDLRRMSVFDLEAPQFDIVFALNIFHHFLKTEETMTKLRHFLLRLECQTMFFQAHRYDEAQMSGAFRNWPPEHFAEFVARCSGLRNLRRIGEEQGRRIFKMWR